MPAELCLDQPIEVARKLAHPLDLMNLRRVVYQSTWWRMSGWVKEEDLTLGWFNLGTPQALFKEMRGFNHQVKGEQFKEELIDLLFSISALGQANMLVEGQAVEVFGGKNNWQVGLRLKTPGQIIKERVNVTGRVADFIKHCGIETPYKFMRGSKILRYQLDDVYQPRIVLGELRGKMEVPEVEDANLQFALRPATVVSVVVREVPVPSLVGPDVTSEFNPRLI